MPPTTPGGAWTRASLYRCSSRCPGLMSCSLELCRLGLTFVWLRRPPIPHMLRGCATLSHGRHHAGDTTRATRRGRHHARDITRATSRGCHYGVGIQGGHHAAGMKRLLRAGCQGGSLAIVARCSRSAFLAATGTAPLLERFLRPEAVWPLRPIVRSIVASIFLHIHAIPAGRWCDLLRFASREPTSLPPCMVPIHNLKPSSPLMLLPSRLA